MELRHASHSGSWPGVNMHVHMLTVPMSIPGDPGPDQHGERAAHSVLQVHPLQAHTDHLLPRRRVGGPDETGGPPRGFSPGRSSTTLLFSWGIELFHLNSPDLASLAEQLVSSW